MPNTACSRVAAAARQQDGVADRWEDIMALRGEELPSRLQSLSGLLTSHQSAEYLQLTYWHFMRLVESGRIRGMRVVDRWLFDPEDLEEYRRSRFGDLEDAARAALSRKEVTLTAKQERLCRQILDGRRPSDIARDLQLSRQAIHAQLGIIRDKVVRSESAYLSKQQPTDPQRHRPS
jgi:excisionase family DNA binding protein